MSINLPELLANQPSYRQKQIHKAWFDKNLNSYEQITTLPKSLREELKGLPWISVKEKTILKSKIDDTQKALLELEDGSTIETVLLGREDRKANAGENKRYTICISTQVGCPMGCSFCATGQMGFTRNLTTEEIVDQYRFWNNLVDNRIANIVLMGQGEPFLNYDNVKNALNIILANTDLGPTKIMISTVGIEEPLENLLLDKDFPPVRLTFSLHSADETLRKKLIPSHQAGFLEFLIDWSKRYHIQFPSKSHFIGLEYIMLDDINDSKEDLRNLKKLASKLGNVRINLIPYNTTDINKPSDPNSSRKDIPYDWEEELNKAGLDTTVRNSQGQDIMAACGQLQNKVNK